LIIITIIVIVLHLHLHAPFHSYMLLFIANVKFHWFLFLLVTSDFAHQIARVYQSISLSANIHAHDDPLELIFLEEVLRETVDGFQRRLRLVEPVVNYYLDKAANDIYSDTGVQQLVPLKDALQSIEIHVKQSLDCVTRLLNNDDDMLHLLISEQSQANM
jgi:hypothetical protein